MCCRRAILINTTQETREILLMFLILKLPKACNLEEKRNQTPLRSTSEPQNKKSAEITEAILCNDCSEVNRINQDYGTG